MYFQRYLPLSQNFTSYCTVCLLKPINYKIVPRIKNPAHKNTHLSHTQTLNEKKKKRKKGSAETIMGRKEGPNWITYPRERKTTIIRVELFHLIVTETVLIYIILYSMCLVSATIALGTAMYVLGITLGGCSLYVYKYVCDCTRSLSHIYKHVQTDTHEEKREKKREAVCVYIRLMTLEERGQTPRTEAHFPFMWNHQLYKHIINFFLNYKTFWIIRFALPSSPVKN